MSDKLQFVALALEITSIKEIILGKGRQTEVYRTLGSQLIGIILRRGDKLKFIGHWGRR